jgi:protein-histidine pros-kinase
MRILKKLVKMGPVSIPAQNSGCNGGRRMKLLAKLNLILIVVFALALVPAAMVSRSLLNRNAEAQVIQNARIMMETAMAMRGYTVAQVKPLLAEQMEQTFLPQSVPAYSATEIFNKLREDHPEYTYKEATLNPTNPRNRAVDWETDLVNEFRRNESRAEIVGERDTPLGRSLYLSHPIKVSNEACLSCHTTPEQAPQPMLAAYPGGGGFGWKMNEIIGAQIVQVPMATPIAMADDAFRTMLITLVGVFVVILVVLNLLMQVVVIQPVKKLSALAERVSHGETDVEEVVLRGNDEVAILGQAFNRMRISLAKAMNMLEGE